MSKTLAEKVAAHRKQMVECEPMVLYDCPYCGNTTMKSLIDIRNNDTWVCPYCGKHMKVA